MGEQTAAVSFQNGVVKDEILRRVLGDSHVMDGACYIAATIAEPGLIRHSGAMQKLVFGEYDSVGSARVGRFRDACAHDRRTLEGIAQVAVAGLTLPSP